LVAVFAAAESQNRADPEKEPFLSLEQFISHYGYWAVLAGTLAEGETVVVLGGYAAHQGYLWLPGVIAVAFAGTFLCDQTIFHIGRRYGHALLKDHPRWRARTDYALRLMRRAETAFIMGFRFIYGLRTASPFAIGMSGVSPRKFFILNGISGLVWACAVASAGYLFGHVVDEILSDAARIERYAFVFIAAAAIALWAGLRLWRRVRKGTRASEI
jgi:membrane protein DedA with SNARE-associated domain